MSRTDFSRDRVSRCSIGLSIGLKLIENILIMLSLVEINGTIIFEQLRPEKIKMLNYSTPSGTGIPSLQVTLKV